MIRLPDFTDDPGLNSIREAMGVYQLGTLTPQSPGRSLTKADLDALVSVGIDISSLDEVKAHSDGTLVYKDKRVVLYIRDVNLHGSGRANQDDLPKFHIANCKTLDDMRAQNRFGRYVVAANVTGEFTLNQIRRTGSVKATTERLHVCQNCLLHLRYDGFDKSMPFTMKRLIRDQFSLPIFFQRYPHDVIFESDAEDELTAPLNDYTGDFGMHATAAKLRARYCCEGCGVSLVDRRKRRYLHAHHLNSIKYDNSPDNLRVLCILCHASQPGHDHMRELGDYAAYLQLTG
jgi:hypothetical protein